MNRILVLFFFVTLLLSQNNPCYRNKRMEIVYRLQEGGTAIFTTQQALVSSETSRESLLKSDRWFVRDIAGTIEDVELMNRAGLPKVANLIQEEYDKEFRAKNIQFYVGLPFGIGMVTAGAIWLPKSLAKEEKPTLEIAGGMVLTAVGIGVIYGVISRFSRRYEKDMYAHKIKKTQAMETVDRINRQIKAECQQNQDH